MDNLNQTISICNPSQLSVLSYANHFTLWHYKTPHQTIEAPHYFDNVADILRENDIIIATTHMHDAPRTDLFTILARTKEHVVVSRMNMGVGGDDDHLNGRLQPDQRKDCYHMSPH
jgi:hypothetical protein